MYVVFSFFSYTNNTTQVSLKFRLKIKVNMDAVYNDRNGFISSVWGPGAWMFIHMVALNYPLEPTSLDRQRYRSWFESLGHVLPCGACRRNFRASLDAARYSPDTDFRSRAALFYLTYRLHNAIRIRQGKDTDLTFEQALKQYERFRATDCSAVGANEASCHGKVPVCCTLQVSRTSEQPEQPNRIQVEGDIPSSLPRCWCKFMGGLHRESSGQLLHGGSVDRQRR